MMEDRPESLSFTSIKCVHVNAAGLFQQKHLSDISAGKGSHRPTKTSSSVKCGFADRWSKLLLPKRGRFNYVSEH